MRPIYRCCARIDVHMKSVSVCIRRRARGKPEVIEEAVSGTFTADLEGLSEWLRKHRVRQVAMESTGVYRMPVWNVPESAGRFELLQGHKTDRVDALRTSFIPPKPIVS
jgi:transposase